MDEVPRQDPLIVVEAYLCHYKLFTFSIETQDVCSLTCLPLEFHLASGMLQSLSGVLPHVVELIPG